MLILTFHCIRVCYICSPSLNAEVDRNVTAEIPGAWSSPRTVRLERIPGQSLGISIVGQLNFPSFYYAL